MKAFPIITNLVSYVRFLTNIIESKCPAAGKFFIFIFNFQIKIDEKGPDQEPRNLSHTII